MKKKTKSIREKYANKTRKEIIDDEKQKQMRIIDIDLKRFEKSSLLPTKINQDSKLYNIDRNRNHFFFDKTKINR